MHAAAAARSRTGSCPRVVVHDLHVGAEDRQQQLHEVVVGKDLVRRDAVGAQFGDQGVVAGSGRLAGPRRTGSGSGSLKLFGAAPNPFSPEPDTGADTPVWLTKIGSTTGSFFVNRKQVPTAPHTTDVHRCDRLWNENARLVGLPPEL
ncbi:hypothetical protein AB0D57_21160 [Streptomyces sp. NPDC048275]|uniref:hypothetical protein n=1 Tax=Streptomyces sp. NPDC048275 TaxID=3155629 RepID=UPI0033C70ABC